MVDSVKKQLRTSYDAGESRRGARSLGFRKLETLFLHEHAEPDGYRLHPQAMLLEAA